MSEQLIEVQVPANGGHRRGPRRGHCTICKNSDRGQAELLLAGRASLQSVAKKFDMSVPSLRRHWKNHVSDETKRMLTIGPCKSAELAAKLTDESLSILDHVRIARAAIYSSLDAAQVTHDGYTVSVLVGRLHENINLTAKLTGKLSQSPLVVNNQQNVFMLPAVSELQALLLDVLAKHPDARLEVIRAFQQIEQRMSAPQLEHASVQA